MVVEQGNHNNGGVITLQPSETKQLEYEKKGGAKGRLVALGFLIIFLSFSFRMVTHQLGNNIYSGPDNLYQLIRIENCEETYPFIASFDPKAHYPEGLDVHWPSGLTFIYTTYLKMFNTTVREPFSEDALSVIGPLLGSLIVLLCFCLISRTELSKTTVFFIVLFLILSPDLVRPSSYGELDHHIWTQLSVVLMFFGLKTARLFPIGLGLFIGFFTSAEVMLYFTFFFPFLLLLAQTNMKKKSLIGLLFLPSLFSLLVYFLNVGLNLTSRPFLEFNLFNGGLFQFCWFFSLGLAAYWLYRWTGLTELQTFWKKQHIGKVALVGVVFTVLWGFIFLMSQYGSYFLRFIKLERLIVAEEISPLFTPSFAGSPPWYKLYFLIALLSLFFIIRLANKRVDFIFFFIVTLLSLLEYRHLRVFAPFVLIGMGTIFHELFQFVKQKPNRMWNLIPGLFGFFALGSFALYFIPGYFTKNKIRDRKMHGVRVASEWIKQNGNAVEVFPHSTPIGVASDWASGHHIQYFSGRPVVLDPFNFPVTIERQMLDLYGTFSLEEFLFALDQYQVQYLILVPPNFTLLNLPESMLKGTYRYDKVRGLQVFEEIEKFTYFRFYRYAGLSPEFIGHFQPVLYSEEVMAFDYITGNPAIGYTGRRIRMPHVQLFERKNGASITGEIPEMCTEIAITLEMDGHSLFDNYKVKYSVTPDPEETFFFQTALPAPHETDSFSTENPYCLETPNYYAIIYISQEQVDYGDVIEPVWVLKNESGK